MKTRECTLVHDSARHAQLLGTRAGPSESRTMVFKAKDMSIDLLLHEGSAGPGIVYGQIITEMGGTPISGVRVVLGADEVETDEYGQFVLTTRATTTPHVLRIGTGKEGVTCTVPEE